MFYTLYKITNNINGKIYIGTHKTDNLDDGYFGSGKHLKNSINKYGIENFTKEIMQVFRSAEEMFDMEALTVNEGFVKREDTYNIKEGGFGGFDHITNNPDLYTDVRIMNGKKSGSIHKNKLLVDKEYKDLFIKKHTMYGKNNPHYGKPGTKGFSGKHHTDESKYSMGKKNSKHQTGSGNSNYGKSWVYCPYTHESKPVPRYELKEWEDKGWVKGRKIK